MMLLLLNDCTKSYIIGEAPQIISDCISKGETMCINSTAKYMGVTLNAWSGITLNTYTQFKYPDGPLFFNGSYTDSSQYGGIDFGDSYGHFSMNANKKTCVSISATTFDESSLVRVISNKPQDKLYLDSTAEEYLLITNKQHVEYFNGAPSRQVYSIDLKAEPGDEILFYQNDNNIPIFNYTGTMSETIEFKNEEAVHVVWHTDKEVLSGYMRLNVKATNYKPDSYVRIITNDHQFSMIPLIEVSKFEVWEIVLIVLGSVILFILILLVIIYLIIRKNGYCQKNSCGKYHKEVDEMQI